MSSSPYPVTRDATWGLTPVLLLAGAALTACGVALTAAMSGSDRATGVFLAAWGVTLVSQYGVLAWYVVQIPRLRRRRLEAARHRRPAPSITDFDVRQFHVPLAYVRTSLFFGLLDPGDAPAPRAMKAARVVGTVATIVMWSAVAVLLLSNVGD